ncbi:hypothetical protein HJD18_08145 [Thermoleophilia bacterium SCSIO 60948]|nr:hypothetical protein HJD18_08145 [Thermoleophilia bacterium SCSIO 60948]
MQRLLSHGPQLLARSGVSGRLLTTRARGYLLWRLARGAVHWDPPALDSPDQLERHRTSAESIVRDALVARVDRHREAQASGAAVLGLQMVDQGASGARIVPAIGGPGLPGLYSCDWPTPIGLPGEATEAEARSYVRRGGFRVLEVSSSALGAARRRFREGPLDEAAIAEEVASRYTREEARNVERFVERLLADAGRHEYRHLAPGRGESVGKTELPRAALAK